MKRLLFLSVLLALARAPLVVASRRKRLPSAGLSANPEPGLLLR